MNQPVTPTPPQNASVMAPVGTPHAAHLGPPVGIPSGPSAQELMLQIEKLNAVIGELQARESLPMARARATMEAELPVEKTYYHQTPGSSIVITKRGPQGEHIPETVHFDYHGELVTSDRDVQQFLDGIVNRPGVPVWTKKAPLVAFDAAHAANEVVQAAARSIDKLGAEASRS